MPDLKLGILLWSQGATWPEMLEAAQRVDRLGYDTLWTWDHDTSSWASGQSCRSSRPPTTPRRSSASSAR